MFTGGVEGWGRRGAWVFPGGVKGAGAGGARGCSPGVLRGLGPEGPVGVPRGC